MARGLKRRGGIVLSMKRKQRSASLVFDQCMLKTGFSHDEAHFMPVLSNHLAHPTVQQPELQKLPSKTRTIAFNNSLGRYNRGKCVPYLLS